MLTEDQEAELAQLVSRWSDGDETAHDALFRYLSPLMVRLARLQLQRHGRLLSMESTDLANETTLKLLGLRVRPDSRVHLMRLLATMMRSACIDLARQRKAQKRSGHRVSLSLVDQQPAQEIDLLELDEAIQALAQRDDLAARVTELRFFTGLSETETAAALSVSRATVTRKWKFARLFLSKTMAP